MAPPLEFYKFYDGKRRPKWAGPVVVESENVLLRLSHSDVRDQRSAFDDPAPTIERPTKVSGVILPVSTIGRDTADIRGRNLKYMGTDRGHLMALSLGGPDSQAIMVEQPRGMNQRLRYGFTEDTTIRNLSWRGMEIFFAYAAHYIMRQAQTKQEIDDVLLPSEDWKIINFPKKRYVKNNQFTLDTIAKTSTYKLLDNPPDFFLHYIVVPRYAARGNTPTGLDVEICLCSSANQSSTQIFCKYFKAQQSVFDDNKSLAKAEKMRLIKKVKIQSTYVLRIRKKKP